VNSSSPSLTLSPRDTDTPVSSPLLGWRHLDEVRLHVTLPLIDARGVRHDAPPTQTAEQRSDCEQHAAIHGRTSTLIERTLYLMLTAVVNDDGSKYSAY